jgi:hypothetical protein
MHHLLTAKKMLPIAFASTTNAGTASGTVDRLGFDYATFDVFLPTSDALTNNPSVLRVLHSDTTDATNFSAIATGDSDFTIPNCVTAASNNTAVFATINLSLQARKRYLKIELSPLTTQVVVAECLLQRGKELPDTTTEVNSLVVYNT